MTPAELAALRAVPGCGAVDTLATTGLTPPSHGPHFLAVWNSTNCDACLSLLAEAVIRHQPVDSYQREDADDAYGELEVLGELMEPGEVSNGNRQARPYREVLPPMPASVGAVASRCINPGGTDPMSDDNEEYLNNLIKRATLGDELHSDVRRLLAENAALKAEVEKIKGERDEFHAEYERAVGRKVGHLEAVIHLRNLVENRTFDQEWNDQQEAKTAALTAEVERLHGLWVEAGDARIQLEEDVRTLRAENARLRAENDRLKTSYLIVYRARGYANQNTSASEEPSR